MIRLSRKDDLNDIIVLWNEAFGDSEDDIKFFLDSRYIPENAVVCETDGRIVSVLFLLDGMMHINGKDYSSYYLYAACTSKDFRGKGIMSDMLGFAKSLSISRNKQFIILKPGEESLYGYYEKFGYKSVFTKKTIKINDNFNAVEEIKSENNFLSDILISRDNLLNKTDYFRWDSDAIEFAISHHKHFGGECFLSKNGYIFYYVDNNILFIKENTLSDKSEFLKILSYLKNQYKTNSVIADLPFNYEIPCDKSEISDSGMILPLNKDAENLISGLKNAYLNLALD